MRLVSLIVLSLFLTACGQLNSGFSFNWQKNSDEKNSTHSEVSLNTSNYEISASWENLPEEEAQSQSELLLNTLNEDQQAFVDTFHPDVGVTLELVQEVLEMTAFKDPQNIIVTNIENGVYYYERDGFSASEITGDIDCEYNHDGLAQFYFTLAYDEADKTWLPIGFSVEECLETSPSSE